MILLPAKWNSGLPAAKRWTLWVSGVNVATVWRDDGKWWGGWSYAPFPTAAAAKRAVEKALKARRR